MGRTFQLSQMPGIYAVCRLESASSVPTWATDALSQADFCSITRTAEELSVVCRAELVPDAVEAARDWACFWLHGPFDFGETGILVSLLNPLAEAGVGIFAISTYDTDYILVKQANAESAIRVWSEAGHTVDSPS